MAITDWYWKPTLPKVEDGSTVMEWDIVFTNRRITRTNPAIDPGESGTQPADPNPGIPSYSGQGTGELWPTNTKLYTAKQSIDIVPIDTTFSFQKHGRISFLTGFLDLNFPAIGTWGTSTREQDFAFVFYIQDAGTDTINQPAAPDSKNPKGCFLFRSLPSSVQLRSVPWDLGEPLTTGAGVLLKEVAIPFSLVGKAVIQIEWRTNDGENTSLGTDFTAPESDTILDFFFRMSDSNNGVLDGTPQIDTFQIDYSTVAVGDDENLNRGRPGNSNAGVIEPNGVEMIRGVPTALSGIYWELIGSDELAIIIISEDWELGPNPPPSLILDEPWNPPAWAFNTVNNEIVEDWETP